LKEIIMEGQENNQAANGNNAQPAQVAAPQQNGLVAQVRQSGWKRNAKIVGLFALDMAKVAGCAMVGGLVAGYVLKKSEGASIEVKMPE
jgi:hypothetical protein